MVPRTSALNSCTHLRVRKLSRLVSRFYDAQLAPLGLRTTQFSLLALLYELGPTLPSRLADAMDMDASTLTRSLRPFLIRKWASQEAGGNGRERIVSLTDLGLEKLADARQHWRRAQRQLADVVGAQDLAELAELVDRIQSKLKT